MALAAGRSTIKTGPLGSPSALRGGGGGPTFSNVNKAGASIGAPGSIGYKNVGPAAGGGSALSGLAMPAAPAFAPGTVPRPTVDPIRPEAAYDPGIAQALAGQQGYAQDLKAGTGFAMDVLTGSQADQLQSQLVQARQAAAQAGIPFDEAAWRATAMRGIAGAQADEKLKRESMVGGALGAVAGTAQGQAGERDTRLGLDLNRQTTQNAQKLDLYGRDLEKYGTDVQAATSANNALMSFYSQLMGGVMGALSPGNMSMSSSNYYA